MAGSYSRENEIMRGERMEHCNGALFASDCSSSEVADETVSGDCKRNGVPCTAEVCPQRSGCKELHVSQQYITM